MEEEKKESTVKKKKHNKGLFKYLSLKTILIMTIFLIFNAYAWFIYATQVSTSITVHVKSWDVSFSVDNNQSVTSFSVVVDSIYPGMDNFVQVVDVLNSGEAAAYLTYEYRKVTILGTVYEAGVTTNPDTGDPYTSAEIQDMMEDDFPFTTTITISNDNIGTSVAGSFTITIVWPYESGDDAADTAWGQAAYAFHQNHSTEECLEIELLLIATQNNS